MCSIGIELGNKLLLVKLGGSVITHKNRPFSPNLESLHDIARVLADYWTENRTKNIIVIHGGGSFAHVAASRYTAGSALPSKDKMRISLITWAARKINDRVIESLIDYNLPVFPLQTSSIIAANGGRLRLDETIIKTTIKNGWIPVLYGDVIMGESEAQIASGERVIELLCKTLEVERIIVCTNTNGVLRNIEDPDMGTVESINPTNIRAMVRKLQASSGIDVTGGMKEKVRILYRIAVRMGIRSQIINGTNPVTLYDCLRGRKAAGTRIEGKLS